VQALEGQGITKLVLFNGHGGNDFRWMIRELQPATRVFLCTLNWWQVVDPTPHFTDLGDHAGELETSVMQVVAPSLVRPLAEAGDGRARAWRVTAFREGWAWAPRRWTQVTRDTGIGDPRAATVAKGEAFREAVCEKIAGFLVELATLDPQDLYQP
jgi:creatinine amidohydrolase